MGLDTVEIILRTEETFAVDLPDSECARVVTVGDLYRLILDRLNLPYQPVNDIEDGNIGSNRSGANVHSLASWTSADVWVTLKAIIQDQLQVDPDDIRESVTFIHDLGCE
jgi:acyl carrier protein